MPPLLTRPRLQRKDHEFFRAWQLLDEGRTYGMSAPNAISIAEIEAYCNLTGIASREERLKYLRLMRRLDRAFLGHWAENKNNS